MKTVLNTALLFWGLLLIVSCATGQAAVKEPVAETANPSAGTASPAAETATPAAGTGAASGSEPEAPQDRPDSPSSSLESSLVREPFPDLPGLSLRIETPPSASPVLDEPRVAAMQEPTTPSSDMTMNAGSPGEALPAGPEALTVIAPETAPAAASKNPLAAAPSIRPKNPAALAPAKQEAPSAATDQALEPVLPSSEARKEPLADPLPSVPARPLPQEASPQRPPLARTPPLLPEKEPVFSRSARAVVDQIVEVPFRGSGWVYTGERLSRPGLEYRGRRLDADGQTFLFAARNPGVWELAFFKQDFVEDIAIEDHVRLIVGSHVDVPIVSGFSPPAELSRIVLERWPPRLEEAALLWEKLHPPLPVPPEKGESSPQAPSSTPAIVTPPPPLPVSPSPAQAASPALSAVPVLPAQTEAEAPSAPPGAGRSTAEEGRSLAGEGSSLAELHREALSLLEAGVYDQAIARARALAEQYPEGSPALWLLLARLHETDGPARDIRMAHYWYKRLMEEYPLSREAGEAERRINYLNRFYFGIR